MKNKSKFVSVSVSAIFALLLVGAYMMSSGDPEPVSVTTASVVEQIPQEDPSGLPEDLATCENEMLVLESVSGDTICMGEGDSLLFGDEQEYVLSCYSTLKMQEIECPDRLLNYGIGT